MTYRIDPKTRRIIVSELTPPIKTAVLSGTGSDIGKYGACLYGRCIYGYRKGIYGADTYDNCSYW